MLPQEKLQRRVAGYHDIRMDGMTDLVIRANGASVMDIGCNRGLVGFEFANNGAKLVHGCDNYSEGIQAARDIFDSARENAFVHDPNIGTAQHLLVDLRNAESQFEVVDLTQGPRALKPFHGQHYDIMLCLATLHKLKRVMSGSSLAELVQHLASLTTHYFAWRATSEKFHENETEMVMLDKVLGASDMRRIHTSYISRTLGVAAIWAKGY